MPEKDFSTIGSESFNLPVKAPEKIVLNIQEDKSTSGIVLEEARGLHIPKYTGNVFTDTYHKINEYFLEHAKVKTKDKSVFFHLLAVMISAGVPMVKALRSLSLQAGKATRLKIVTDDLANMIEAGESLSYSLLKYPDIFTQQEIGMVESGEASGRLAQILELLAKDTQKAHEIKSKIRSAMIYPITILLLLVAVIVVMMIYVIPKLKDLFSAMGADLPLLTRIVVGTSDFMFAYKFEMLFVVVALAIFVVVFKKTDVGKYTFHKIKLKIPLFGELFKKAYLSRFSRSLSNLLDSGISIIKCIEITAESIGNEVYRRRLLLSVEDLKQGIPLAENLTESDLFPPMLVNMVDIGEKTAQLSEMTDKVANFYESEVDTAIAGISKIIEPVTLVLIGGTVGVVVAAIMLPIMKLSDMAGGL